MSAIAVLKITGSILNVHGQRSPFRTGVYTHFTGSFTGMQVPIRLMYQQFEPPE
jgi:hypothetical protein